MKVIKPCTMFKKGKPCSSAKEADTLLSYAEAALTK